MSVISWHSPYGRLSMTLVIFPIIWDPYDAVMT